MRKNIYCNLPEAKLLLLLRNPVERAISAIHHTVRTGRISPLSLLNIDRIISRNDKVNLEGYGIWGKGMYYDQIRAYQEYFDQKQILILIYEEDVVENPQHGLETACRFLGADPTFQFQDGNRRIDGYSRSLFTQILDFYFPRLHRVTRRNDEFIPQEKVRPNRAAIQSLYGLYEEPNKKLFKLLGREIRSWKMPEVV